MGCPFVYNPQGGHDQGVTPLKGAVRALLGDRPGWTKMGIGKLD